MSRRVIDSPPSPDSDRPKNIVIKKAEEAERKPHVGPGIRKRLLEEKEKEKEKKAKEEDETKPPTQPQHSLPPPPKQTQGAPPPAFAPPKPPLKRSGEAVPTAAPSHQEILRRHNEEFNRQQNKRTALAAVASRPCFYIAVDSMHGNVIIPVLPTVADGAPDDQKR